MDVELSDLITSNHERVHPIKIQFQKLEREERLEGEREKLTEAKDSLHGSKIGTRRFHITLFWIQFSIFLSP